MNIDVDGDLLPALKLRWLAHKRGMLSAGGIWIYYILWARDAPIVQVIAWCSAIPLRNFRGTDSNSHDRCGRVWCCHHFSARPLPLSMLGIDARFRSVLQLPSLLICIVCKY